MTQISFEAIDISILLLLLDKTDSIIISDCITAGFEIQFHQGFIVSNEIFHSGSILYASKVIIKFGLSIARCRPNFPFPDNFSDFSINLNESRSRKVWCVQTLRVSSFSSAGMSEERKTSKCSIELNWVWNHIIYIPILHIPK